MMLAPPEEGDPAGAEEAAMQDVVIVRLDLRLAGPFLKPPFRPAALYCAVPQDSRGNAVEDRGLMQLDERIRVLPVSAGGDTTIDLETLVPIHGEPIPWAEFLDYVEE